MVASSILCLHVKASKFKCTNAHEQIAAFDGNGIPYQSPIKMHLHQSDDALVVVYMCVHSKTGAYACITVQ